MLITLAACFFSYKFGSAPAVRAATTTAEWSIFSNVHSSADDSATRPAVAGVQHVADCIIAGALNSPGSTALGPVAVKLYDGSSTTSPSTVLLDIELPQPDYTVGGGQFQVCGLNLQGTAGRPMELQIGGFLSSSPYLSANLVGHDN
ncbi:MAG: hypothetical protein WBV69_04615 [Candidatus Sulfotelmatobacter sp.]